MLLCACFVVQRSSVHILDTESFKNTFGPKAQRKKPHLPSTDMEVRDTIGQLVSCYGDGFHYYRTLLSKQLIEQVSSDIQ